MSNKLKIFNDPIYGFISIPGDLVFDLIEHPYFQRLRRIQQLGLGSYVYPGALHTRFHHALGAMHLMNRCIEILRHKGTPVSEEEAEAVIVAILLHDIGHGPFSHALESSLVKGVHHEQISILLMEEINRDMNGRLSLAISIFRDQYDRKFFHELVSSQLDMDRLDYLMRDSFFTGVSEGVISSDRIIHMLRVVDDRLAVEYKGIYSVEKFIIARRLMYWQVYLHKTVLCAENMLVALLRRAGELARSGKSVAAGKSLAYFLKNEINPQEFFSNQTALEHYCRLDDSDVVSAIKEWQDSEDFTLRMLSVGLVNRRLHHIELLSQKPDHDKIEKLLNSFCKHYNQDRETALRFINSGVVSNSAYNAQDENIRILFNDGRLVDISKASDQLNISALSQAVEKFYLSYPKELLN